MLSTPHSLLLLENTVDFLGKKLDSGRYEISVPNETNWVSCEWIDTCKLS